MPAKPFDIVGSLSGKLESTLLGLSGFYFAGAWAALAEAPFMNALSSRKVIRAICHSDGVPFVPPHGWPDNLPLGSLNGSGPGTPFTRPSDPPIHDGPDRARPPQGPRPERKSCQRSHRSASQSACPCRDRPWSRSG